MFNPIYTFIPLSSSTSIWEIHFANGTKIHLTNFATVFTLIGVVQWIFTHCHFLRRCGSPSQYSLGLYKGDSRTTLTGTGSTPLRKNNCDPRCLTAGKNPLNYCWALNGLPSPGRFIFSRLRDQWGAVNHVIQDNCQSISNLQLPEHVHKLLYWA